MDRVSWLNLSRKFRELVCRRQQLRDVLASTVRLHPRFESHAKAGGNVRRDARSELLGAIIGEL